VRQNGHCSLSQELGVYVRVVFCQGEREMNEFTPCAPVYVVSSHSLLTVIAQIFCCRGNEGWGVGYTHTLSDGKSERVNVLTHGTFRLNGRFNVDSIRYRVFILPIRHLNLLLFNDSTKFLYEFMIY
jgi:hypothetical protein